MLCRVDAARGWLLFHVHRLPAKTQNDEGSRPRGTTCAAVLCQTLMCLYRLSMTWLCNVFVNLVHSGVISPQKVLLYKYATHNGQNKVTSIELIGTWHLSLAVPFYLAISGILPKYGASISLIWNQWPRVRPTLVLFFKVEQASRRYNEFVPCRSRAGLVVAIGCYCW